jgi:hypothetical protein
MRGIGDQPGTVLPSAVMDTAVSGSSQEAVRWAT